jgi:hypothetical protein
MEWRCEWCGKPHEEDDPPCDNCGHGKFEKAVVRQTDLAEGNERETTLVWVCTDCGREHPKHSPPCSRCGNVELEKQRQHVDEAELTAPGYLDLLTPQYLAAFLFTLLVAAVFVSGVLGIVDVPGFDQGGEVENVPGNKTTAGETDIADIEEAYVSALNGRFQEQNDGTLERNEELDELATRYNQRSIKAAVADGQQVDEQEFSNRLSDVCQVGQGAPEISLQTVSIEFTGNETAKELGERITWKMLEEHVFGPAFGANAIGVDIHYLDGQLYVAQFLCET